MAHRVGVCRTCRTKFQIPASFTPKQAKCRNCGGVVEIGRPEGAPVPAPPRRDTEPAPPRAQEPAPAPQPVPDRAPPPAPLPPATTPPRREPVTAGPVGAAPKRKSGLVRALLVAGIAAVLAVGLWSLLA